MYALLLFAGPAGELDLLHVAVMQHQPTNLQPQRFR